MRKTSKEDLVRIEREMQEAEKAGDAKRLIFLAATYNRYSKELGLKEKYKW